MPRKSTVKTHPKREKIEAALLAGEPLRNIAKRFGVSVAALHRHKNDHLPEHLSQAHAAAEIAQADNLTAELKRIMARINLLFDACDQWLRDPDNPDQYDLGPRADDVHVVYLEAVGETADDEPKMVRRKARLSELLRRVEQQGLGVVSAETKHADPRELILKTAQRLEAQLELLAKLLGELQQEGTINIYVNPEWLELRATIITALDAHPKAKQAVLKALSDRDAGE